jgi:MSHA biogenesis protein MshP
MKKMQQVRDTKQRGFGAIAAIIILVILAIISAGLVKLGTTQQVTSAQDVLSARAWQAARAGNEWGLYRALRLPPKDCPFINETLDLSSTVGFWVTVNCTKSDFNEGQNSDLSARTISIYTIEATACNSSTCPDPALADKPGYVERKRVVTACDTGALASCY